MSEKTADAFTPGLEGVVATRTRLSKVDGTAGRLVIGGCPIEELAGRASFEETLYLLWKDTLPDGEELAALREELARHRALPEIVVEVLGQAATERVAPMDALRMASGMLGLGSSGKGNDKGQDKDDDYDDALRIVAASPTIVAAYWRLYQGWEPVDPDPELPHAANYLYMLSGEVPSAEKVQALETYLTTVADHGMNASTFAARVIVSTRSDLVSAVMGAVGALK